MLLRTLIRAFTIAVMVYLFLIGATYNGVMLPQVQSTTLPLMILLLVGWFSLHQYKGWKWHQTPLDGVFVIWCIAFGVSLVANLEDWRRISIALWYMGLYIGVWYVLSDMLANGVLRRETLIDGVIIAGGLLVVMGYYQLANAGYSPLGFLGLPRPTSFLGNPNSLATYLVVLISFSVGRLINVRTRVFKLALIMLILAALFMLFLTFSRGGWLAIGFGLLVVMLLILADTKLLSVGALRRWLSEQKRIVQAVFVGAVLATFIVLAGIGVIFLDSLNEQGRTLDYRTYLYSTAIETFLEKPVTGHGLFTYGKAVETIQIRHPEYPRKLHNHAHNIIIHVASELGVFGLIALFATVWFSVRAFRANWRSGREHAFLIAGAGGATAFATHHMLDVTAMLPGLALLAVVALLVTIAPIEPQYSPARRWVYAGVVGLWIVLLASGVWSASLYGRFLDMTYSVFQDGQLIPSRTMAAAQAMQPIINADPQLPPYRLQQAMFYGLAANEGDTAALQAGIDAYRQLTGLLPNTAMVYANLAALLWQAGEQQEALDTITYAVELDPALWQFKLVQAQYAEAVGNNEMALEAYSTVLSNEQVLLHPAIQASPIGRGAVENLPLEGLNEVIVLYLREDFDAALAAWETLDELTVPAYIMRELIALAQNDRDVAQQWLSQAQLIARDLPTPIYNDWVTFGESRLNGGNDADVMAEITPPLLETNYGRGSLLAQSQFLRDMLPIAYVPQLGYSEIDPGLLRLLSSQQ